jgi:hypothetical protein
MDIKLINAYCDIKNKYSDIIDIVTPITLIILVFVQIVNYITLLKHQRRRITLTA